MSFPKEVIREYKSYLQLEKNLSENSIEAYLHDVTRLWIFLGKSADEISLANITLHQLQDYLAWLNDFGISARTQARNISSIKSFFNFLTYSGNLTEDPSVLLEAPKIGKKLPVVLTLEEIDRLIAAIDLSKPEGHRNKAIIETLYGCGLRVTELVDLRLTDIHRNEGF